MGWFSGEPAKVEGGLQGLGGGPMAAMLSLVSALINRQEQEGATSENAKRYYDILRNSVGLYNQQAPQIYNLAKQSKNNAFAQAETGLPLWLSMNHGTPTPNLADPDYFRRAYQWDITQPSQYTHGMGTPYSTFDLSPRSSGYLEQAGADTGQPPKPKRGNGMTFGGNRPGNQIGQWLAQQLRGGGG